MHPSQNLKPEWVNIIREAVPEAEKAGKLQAQQLELLYQQGWFKFLVPKAYSGLQLDMPQMVRLEESLAWANGSLGWVVTLCAGAAWFGGFLDAELATEIMTNPQLCFAGSGASTGTATISGDGYIINGTWKYASGAHHATHLTANCIIKNGDETVLNDKGEPLILPFVFDRKDVTLFRAWKYVGMMATGSDAYEVKDLYVDKTRCFQIDPEYAVIDAPLYRYPFLQLAEATLAANLSGLAVHFLDLCGPAFSERMNNPRLTEPQKEYIKQLLADQTVLLNETRAAFYEAVDYSWHNFESAGDSGLEQVSLMSRKLAKASRESVDKLYTYCGLSAANPDTEINQVWRDMHTAGQHSLLTF